MLWPSAHRPMARLNVRSNTDSLPSRLRPNKKSLPDWYVVNARLTLCTPSQSEKPGEAVTSTQGSGVLMEVSDRGMRKSSALQDAGPQPEAESPLNRVGRICRRLGHFWPRWGSLRPTNFDSTTLQESPSTKIGKWQRRPARQEFNVIAVFRGDFVGKIEAGLRKCFFLLARDSRNFIRRVDAKCGPRHRIFIRFFDGCAKWISRSLGFPESRRNDD